ncbi:LysE family translocator [Aliagarivorans taiwanensis]|uniref:LysE family translocator n=1 Tax=Aliagarivorans taiwanensis TaxID=561966 RepID=UPI000419F21B|nr:LysE family translocator [Aliagarivorans taiwanensis]
MWVFASMVAFGLVGAATPGPVNLIAASNAVGYGYRGTLRFVAGASVAYALVVACSASALELIGQQLPMLTFWLRLAGAGLLLYMAWQIFQSAQLDESAKQQMQAGFWQGALLQVRNPKAWTVAASGVSLFVLGREPAVVYAAAFTLISLTVCFMGVSVWAGAGHWLRPYLSRREYYRQFSRASALLLASLVVVMIHGEFLPN